MSKFFTYPEFSVLPCTDAADVPENIQNWVNRGKPDTTFSRCIKTSQEPYAIEGYYWKKDEDFTEVKELVFVFRYNRKGYPYKVKFTRKAYRPNNRGFLPLCWSARPIEVEFNFMDVTFKYHSDRATKLKFIQIIKDKSFVTT